MARALRRNSFRALIVAATVLGLIVGFEPVVRIASADPYSDALKEWCAGLSATVSPRMVSAGSDTTVTVTRNPSDPHVKTLVGLELYSIGQDGGSMFEQQIWTGVTPLENAASISYTIPRQQNTGRYHYQVLVTNILDDGTHGPDCREETEVFEVTRGGHAT